MAALAALLVGLLFSVHDLASGGSVRTRRRAQHASVVGYGLMLFALFLLAMAFLAGDLSIYYVWRNVDLRYPWYQRLSGLWVGREGSLLLWTTLTLTFWMLEEWRHHRLLRRGPEAAVASARTAHGTTLRAKATDAEALAAAEKVRSIARTLLIAVTLLMLLAVLVGRPFASTAAGFLAAEPLGRGVNPQLIIAFNAIHPPIVFIGYALTALPTAFALGHLVTGHDTWIGAARRWAQGAFLFLTLGVGLGGLWAYIALGWGGYWAWDPVEVASLVPWIATTTFLHAAYRHDGPGEFAVAAPLLGFLMLPAALFSTFVVRAGGVWVSLHSFLGPGAAVSAWARYLEALRTTPEVQLYTVLLGSALLFLPLLVWLQVRRVEAAEAERPAAPAAPGKDLVARWMTLSHLFVVGVLTLALLGTVTVTLLFLGVNGFPSDQVREQVFTSRTGPLALVAVTVMALAISIGVLRRRDTVLLLGGALAVGAAAAVLLRDHWALAMAVPVLVVAALIALARVVSAWRRNRPRQAVRASGIHLVHLGVAVLLLGHGFVSTFETVHEPVEFRVGESRQAGPYLLTLTALDARDTDDNGRLDRVFATFHVQEGERDHGTVHTGFQYYHFQDHYKPDVGLAVRPDKDVYFAPTGLHDPTQGWVFGNLPLGEQGGREAQQVDGFAVQVSTLPYIQLVWAGLLLMILGAALLTSSTWWALRPEPDARSARQARATTT